MATLNENSGESYLQIQITRKRRSVGIILATFSILVLLGTGSAQRMQAQTETVLHSFTGSDGQLPFSGLIMDANGNLYGTTQVGGIGGGNVFELVKSTGTYSESVLHVFTNTDGDGADPYAGLIMDANGNLYGTTQGSGIGFGTVFELVNSNGSYSERTLYTFTGSNGDGVTPFAGLIMDANGNLYGTTQGGGSGRGTVFELVNSGGTYTETVLHSFSGGDGAFPYAGLMMDSSGDLYGTTEQGGAHSQGTVFKLDALGNETVLHSFAGPDGANPYAALIRDSSGNLYGTTVAGGASGLGTVFKLDASGNETVLHSCSVSNGDIPFAGLVRDSSGNLYGTTQQGGAYSQGTVFKLDVLGNETVLHSFAGPDGANPYATLIMDANGNLYGTTQKGGASGDGTVFEISPANTPTGSNISVMPTDSATNTSPVSLTFSSITRAGNTTLMTGSSGPGAPQGFKLGTPATYYNLATTATYSGSISICINYSGVSFHNPSQLSIWHFDTSVASWTQLSTTMNTTTMTACAVTPSLSPFALLEPAYAAQIQSPINADGSSIFSSKRGVVPIKFSATYGGASTCQLPQATISLIRTAGSSLGSVDETVYASSADTGSYFRIDTAACQYVYNLASVSLGKGTYEVDISIEGQVVGSGTFGLQ